MARQLEHHTVHPSGEPMIHQTSFIGSLWDLGIYWPIIGSIAFVAAYFLKRKFKARITSPFSFSERISLWVMKAASDQHERILSDIPNLNWGEKSIVSYKKFVYRGLNSVSDLYAELRDNPKRSHFQDALFKEVVRLMSALADQELQLNILLRSSEEQGLV